MDYWKIEAIEPWLDHYGVDGYKIIVRHVCRDHELVDSLFVETLDEHEIKDACLVGFKRFQETVGSAVPDKFPALVGLTFDAQGSEVKVELVADPTVVAEPPLAQVGAAR